MKVRAFYRAGFSLIEVALALGVAAVSLLAIFGLFTVGIQTNHTAIEQSSSSDILAEVAADLRATPKTISISPQFGISIPAGNTASTTTLYFNSLSKPSATIVSDSRYALTVKFLINGGGTRTATFVNLRMTWPAAAVTTGVNTGSAETFVALDRN